MVRETVGGALAIAIGLAGCATGLSTLPDRTATMDRGDATRGIPYSLPMLQHEITLTRAINACPEFTDLGLGADEPVFRASGLVLSSKAEVEPIYVPGERYVVDYGRLDRPFKTSSFGFEEYPSGALKSVNVAADDQTADAIGSAVGIGLKVAGLAAGKPLLPADAPGSNTTVHYSALSEALALSPFLKRRPAAKFDAAGLVEAAIRRDLERLAAMAQQQTLVVCRPKIARALAELETLREGRDALEHSLSTMTAQVGRASVLAGAKAATVAHVDALGAALDDLNTTTADLSTAIESIAEIDKVRSDISEVVWPPAFNVPPDDFGPLGDEIYKSDALNKLLEVRTIRTLSGRQVESWLAGAHARVVGEVLASSGLTVRERQRLRPTVEKLVGSTLTSLALVRAFHDTGGEPLDDSKPPEGCVGVQTTVSGCIAAQLGVSAQLKQTRTGLMPCTLARGSTDCMSQAALVETNAYGKQTRGRAPDGSALVGRHARDNSGDMGLFVRSRATAVLTLCRTTLGDTLKCEGDAIYTSEPEFAPQLGQLRFLPFRNGPFEANELSLKLREDGSIEKFEYKKTRAAGKEALAATLDAIDQVEKFKESRADHSANALDAFRKEELAKIDFETQKLDKQAALLKAQTPETPDEQAGIKEETAKIEAETALLNAKIAKLKAESALANGGKD